MPHPEQSQNPYEAPAQLDTLSHGTAAILLPQRLSPTPLFRWLMVIVLLEFALSPMSLAAEYWPSQFANPHTYLTCLGINAVVLAVLSWQIGRRMSAGAAILLGQITHLAAWLVFIVINCLLTDWGFRPEEWKWLLIMIGSSAGFSVLLATTASLWFRLPTIST